MLAWHAQPWRHARRAVDRGAHALLISGDRGLGKGQFAIDFAAVYLCASPASDVRACGACDSCHWLAAGTHPDFILIERPSDDDDGEKISSAASGAREKPIGVDQIRGLTDILSVSAHRSAGKVVLIRPAEAMNAAASNALLKSLEEPPSGVLFLLICDRPALLLPTVRSRCQTVSIRLHDPQAAAQWLKGQGIEQPELPLALAGGAPLEAAVIAADAMWARREAFLRELAADSSEPVAIAERFRELPPALVLSWLQKWTYDVLCMRSCARVRYHVDLREAIERAAASIDPIRVTRLHRTLSGYRRHVNHPLNARLFIEQMLIEYAGALKPGEN